MIKDEWHVQDTPRKRDKLFIRKRDIQNLVDDLPDDLPDAKPDVIHLLDEEMFHDVDGNSVDIEVVGKRVYDECYFSVDDIVIGFDMKNLHDTILDNRTDYEKDVHYKLFTNEIMNLTNPEPFRNSKIQTYLTY